MAVVINRLSAKMSNDQRLRILYQDKRNLLGFSKFVSRRPNHDQNRTEPGFKTREQISKMCVLVSLLILY